MFKLRRYLRDYKKESVIGPLFKLLEACFELLVPLVMARIVDVGIRQADVAYIMKMSAVMVAFGLLGLLCSVTAQYFAAKAATGFGTALRADLFSHINSFSYAGLDKLGTSTLVTRLTSDINQAQAGVNLFLRLFLRSPFIVAGDRDPQQVISAERQLRQHQIRCGAGAGAFACDLRHYDGDDPHLPEGAEPSGCGAPSDEGKSGGSKSSEGLFQTER